MNKIEFDKIFNEIKDYDNEQLYALIEKESDGEIILSDDHIKRRDGLRSYNRTQKVSLFFAYFCILMLFGKWMWDNLSPIPQPSPPMVNPEGPHDTHNIPEYVPNIPTPDPTAYYLLIAGATFGLIIFLIAVINDFRKGIHYPPNELVKICKDEINKKSKPIKKIIKKHPNTSLAIFEIINFLAPSITQKDVKYTPLLVTAVLLVLIRLQFFNYNN